MFVYKSPVAPRETVLIANSDGQMMRTIGSGDCAFWRSFYADDRRLLRIELEQCNPTTSAMVLGRLMTSLVDKKSLFVYWTTDSFFKFPSVD